MSPNPKKYYPPTRTEYVTIGLDSFSDEDISEYMDQRGITRPEGKGLFIESDDLNRIETLALCGHTSQARTEALELISNKIGRPL